MHDDANSDEHGPKLHAVRVSTSGTFSGHTFHDRGTGDYPNALSAAVGHRVDGSPVIAFGMDDGTVKLWDPAVTSRQLVVAGHRIGAAPETVDVHRPDRRYQRHPGSGRGDSRGNSAQVLRYSGATTLAPLPVAPNGGTTTDVGGIRAWFPGYKTGRVCSTTTPSSEIQLDFATRPNASYGCWFSRGFDGRRLADHPVVMDP